MTPLTTIKYAKNVATVQFLLEKGADINGEIEGINILRLNLAKHPSAPEQIAILNMLVDQFPQTVIRAQTLLAEQGIDSLIHYTMTAFNYEIAALLIEKGVSFTDQDVLQAVKANKLNIVESMIKKGLDITKPNESGSNFLLQYIQQAEDPKISILKYLCNNGVDPKRSGSGYQID